MQSLCATLLRAACCARRGWGCPVPSRTGLLGGGCGCCCCCCCCRCTTAEPPAPPPAGQAELALHQAAVPHAAAGSRSGRDGQQGTKQRKVKKRRSQGRGVVLPVPFACGAGHGSRASRARARCAAWCCPQARPRHSEPSRPCGRDKTRSRHMRTRRAASHHATHVSGVRELSTFYDVYC